ncbi:MAG: CvpA family protein [Rhodothermales bacterium]
MATLDIIILAIIAFGLIRGMRTGFIRQVTTLAGIVVAFVAAATFMDDAGNLFEQYTGMVPELAPLAGFVAIFLLCRLFIRLFGFALDDVAEKAKLGGLNRLAGGATGALKAVIVMSLAFLFVGFLELPSAPARASSEFYKPVSEFVPEAWQYLSRQSPAFEDMRKELERRLREGSGALPV